MGLVVTKSNNLIIVLRLIVHSKRLCYQTDRRYLTHTSRLYYFVLDVTYVRNMMLNEVRQRVTTYPGTGQVVTTALLSEIYLFVAILENDRHVGFSNVKSDRMDLTIYL